MEGGVYVVVVLLKQKYKVLIWRYQLCFSHISDVTALCQGHHLVDGDA